jgi:S-adenosyl methyltransferase
VPDFDSNKPSIARVYDYLLGGTDNFAVDREQGARLIQVEATTLFDGMELMPPGLVDARQWHPGRSALPALPPREGQAISGVARII